MECLVCFGWRLRLEIMKMTRVWFTKNGILFHLLTGHTICFADDLLGLNLATFPVDTSMNILQLTVSFLALPECQGHAF